MIKATRTEISHTTDCEGNSISVGDIIEIEKKLFLQPLHIKGWKEKSKELLYISKEKKLGLWLHLDPQKELHTLMNEVL